MRGPFRVGNPLSVVPNSVEPQRPLAPWLFLSMLAIAVVPVLFALLFPTAFRQFFSSNYLPHAYCYLRSPALIWTHVVSDATIGISYVAISLTLAYLIYKVRHDLPFGWIFLAFGLFIVACGATHFMEVVTIWIPVYVISAAVKIITALASLVTAVVLPLSVPKVRAVIREAQTSRTRALMLQKTTEDLRSTQAALQRSHDDLESKIQKRTIELESSNKALQEQISQKNLIEEHLAEYAAIVESSEDAILSKDIEGVIRAWNKGAERLYGYAAGEVLGKSITLLFPKDRVEEEKQIVARIKRGEQIRHYETTRVTKNGEKVDVSLGISPIKNSYGEIIGASAIARDIGIWKRAQEILRDQAEVLDLAQVFVRDLDDKIVLWNKGSFKLYGYSVEEALGRSSHDLLKTKFPEPLAQIKQKLVKAGIWEGELVHLRRDETPMVVASTWVLQYDNEGNPKRILEANTDISDRTRAEEALKESEKQYRTLFDNNPMPMWVFDRITLKFLAVNDAAVRHYGYSREEFLSQTILDIRSVEYKDAVRKAVKDNARGLSKPESWQHRKKDGSIIDVEITTHDMLLNGRDAELVLANDITQAKRLEEQFRQAQKMEAVGRLAGGMAHDFNNLLGVIIGYCDISRDHLHQDHVVSKNLDQIKKSADRATALTRQLLAFSRQQVLQPRTLDLNAVVHNISKMFLRVIGEDIKLSFSPAVPLGSVKADLGQIEQVLMNLVINSRDAMPKGGRIFIETANITIDEDYVQKHNGVVLGNYVLLSVSDTGCGMDEKTRARIFEPFFTTKAPGEGTGLGLSTVYGIVKQSSGNIWVYSEPDKGTTFKIYLPRIEQRPDSLIEPHNVSSKITGTETILLVEDDDALRELTKSTLESSGYKVLEASNGMAGIKIAKNYSADIHLLLTDVIMPGVSGGDLAKELIQLRPNLRVLYTSGYTGNLIAHHGVLDIETRLLQKPYGKNALLTSVQTALQNQKEK